MTALCMSDLRFALSRERLFLVYKTVLSRPLLDFIAVDCGPNQTSGVDLY